MCQIDDCNATAGGPYPSCNLCEDHWEKWSIASGRGIDFQQWKRQQARSDDNRLYKEDGLEFRWVDDKYQFLEVTIDSNPHTVRFISMDAFSDFILSERLKHD